jgi:hypothetical protein
MVDAESVAAVLLLPSCAGVVVVPAGLAPPNKPVVAGAEVVAAAVVVAGAVAVVVAVVLGAVVEAGLANRLLADAGAAELGAAVVVAGFKLNRFELAGVEPAAAVLAEVAAPNKLGVVVAEDAAGAVVVAGVAVEAD